MAPRDEQRAGRASTDGALPEYSVRVSQRARQVRLVMTAARGLEVVVPRRFDKRRIPGLVEDKLDWIERARARVAARRQALEDDPPRLPERIVLTALGREWPVEYRQAPLGRAAAGTAVRESKGTLVVTGNLDDAVACRDALRRWLARTAGRTLLARLVVLSLEHQLPYDRASIRQQRTRWGSCSRQGAISLNSKLLFLPPEVVDYVLLHELCHTRELNHSARFWTLLGGHDPDCHAHRKRLRKAGDLVPAWLEHDPRPLPAAF